MWGVPDSLVGSIILRVGGILAIPLVIGLLIGWYIWH